MNTNSLGLNTIKKLKPCVFQYKQLYENGLVSDNSLKHLGFIAQDLIEIFPEDEFFIVKKNETGYYTVELNELIAPIVKSIQELDIRISEIESKLKWRCVFKQTNL